MRRKKRKGLARRPSSLELRKCGRVVAEVRERKLKGGGRPARA